MEVQDLAQLEQKVEALLQYCSDLKNQKQALQTKTAEQEEKIRELEQKIQELEAERSDVKSRVSNILSKLEIVDMDSEEASSNESNVPF